MNNTEVMNPLTHCFFSAFISVEISDTMMHFDKAMDEQMCEDVMSLMDDTQRKYGYKYISISMHVKLKLTEKFIYNLFN